MSRLFACACAVLAVVATASPGSAHGWMTKTQELRVSYADLDMSRAEGATTLLARLQLASQQVCGGRPDLRDLSGLAAFDQCYKGALSSAVASVHSDLLVTLYTGKDAPVERHFSLASLFD